MVVINYGSKFELAHLGLGVRFQISRFRFHLKALTDIDLRGIHPDFFYRAFCEKMQAMAPAFMAPLGLDPSLQSEISPLIWVPILNQKPGYLKGSRFDFELVLCGSSYLHFSVCLAVVDALARNGIGHKLEETGEQGRFAIESVEQFHPLLAKRIIFNGEDQVWREFLPPTTIEDFVASVESLQINQIMLEFQTPAVIMNEDVPIGLDTPKGLDLPLGEILERLIDRITSVAEGMGAPIPIAPEDAKPLIELADKVYSDRSTLEWVADPQSPYGGGLSGSIVYEGDFAPLLMPMALSEWLNIGEGATYGNGKITVVQKT